MHHYQIKVEDDHIVVLKNGAFFETADSEEEAYRDILSDILEDNT